MENTSLNQTIETLKQALQQLATAESISQWEQVLNDHHGTAYLRLVKAYSLAGKVIAEVGKNPSEEVFYALPPTLRVSKNANVLWARAITLGLFATQNEADTFAKQLKLLFQTASGVELVMLFKILPTLPFHKVHIELLREGLRSNVSEVFDSIALGNPYPAEVLPDEAFNQLVLKSAFNSKPFSEIIGLQQRKNPELLRMLGDFIAERTAAGRAVSEEWVALLKN